MIPNKFMPWRIEWEASSTNMILAFACLLLGWILYQRVLEKDQRWRLKLERLKMNIIADLEILLRDIDSTSVRGTLPLRMIRVKNIEGFFTNKHYESTKLPLLKWETMKNIIQDVDDSNMRLETILKWCVLLTGNKYIFANEQDLSSLITLSPEQRKKPDYAIMLSYQDQCPCYGDILLSIDLKKKGKFTIDSSLDQCQIYAMSRIQYEMEHARDWSGEHTAYAAATDGNMISFLKVHVKLGRITYTTLGGQGTALLWDNNQQNSNIPTPGIQCLISILSLSVRNLGQKFGKKYKMGGFTLTRVLGNGAFSTVYQGEKNGSIIALKVKKYLERHWSKKDYYEHQLLPEWKVLRDLQPLACRNVPRLLFPSTERHLRSNSLIAYADVGIPLQVWLLKNVKKNMAEKFPEIAKFVCDGIKNALQQAHSVGCVHRDVRPANVIIVENASTKNTPDYSNNIRFPQLIDWGNAEPIGKLLSLTWNGQICYLSDSILSLECTDTTFYEANPQHDFDSVHYLYAAMCNNPENVMNPLWDCEDVGEILRIRSNICSKFSS